MKILDRAWVYDIDDTKMLTNVQGFSRRVPFWRLFGFTWSRGLRGLHGLVFMHCAQIFSSGLLCRCAEDAYGLRVVTVVYQISISVFRAMRILPCRSVARFLEGFTTIRPPP